MAQQSRQALTIIRRRQLEQQLRLSRSSIYARLDPKSPYYDPDFPRPIRLGAGSVGWIESEVERYVQLLIERSRGAVA